jgi:hypothetical protein
LTWPYAFETFRRSEHVSDEAIWLFVCALREHGEHLLRYPTGRNWKAMESNGLVHVGALLPELRGGAAYLSTGIDRVVAEFERQFYPDGMQDELAPAYSRVSLVHMVGALRTAASLPETRGTRLPDPVRERPTEIVTGYATLAAPDGRCPPLHDSPPLDVKRLYRDLCGEGRPWEPSGVTADRLPWGGYGILRRDVEGTAGRYGLLDAGPYGTGHQHADSLQFLGYEGRWRTVDPGKPQYTDADVSDHLRSAPAHNVALLDGRSHQIVPRVHRTDDPLPVAVAGEGSLTATAATRTFENEAGDGFEQERTVADTPAGWIVHDRVRPADEQSHGVEWLWHLPTADDRGRGDPERIALEDGGATVRHDDATVTRVDVRASRPIESTLAAADRDPWRGWGPSGDSRDPERLPVLRNVADRASGSITAVTLLRPSGDAAIESVEFHTEATTVDLGETTLTFSGRDVHAVDYESTGETARVELDDHRWP